MMKVSFGDIGTKSEQLICFRKGTQHKGNMVAIPMSLKSRSSHTLKRWWRKKVALITFIPPAEKQWLWTEKIGFGVLWRNPPKWVRQRHHLNLYPPNTVQLLTKYTLSVFFLYRNIHLWVSLKCCPPYHFHWSLVPVVSTVGTGE